MPAPTQEKAKPAVAGSPTPATGAATNGDEALSFSELMPAGTQKSLYAHINTYDGQSVTIKNVGNESNDKDAKNGWYVVLKDETRLAVPATTAKKVIDSLALAEVAKKQGKGNGMVRVQVKKLERGVRLA